MSFAAPLWLLAVAAILVPLLLHRRGDAATVRRRVGSIALLVATQQRSRAWTRLVEPLLLAVRCVLLTAVALTLAGPRWSSPGPATWVLLDPELLAARDADEAGNDLEGEVRAGEAGFWSDLDAARASAERSLWLAPGLPPVGRELVQRSSARDASDWALLVEADRMAPPGVELHVFSFDRLQRLGGERPVTSRPVRWRRLAEDRSTEWLERASGPTPRTEGIVATSDYRGTQRRRVDLADPDLAISADARPPVRQVAAAIRHGAERAGDAAVARAALIAAADAALTELRLTVADLAEPLAGELDLVVWLDAALAPGSAREGLRPGGILLEDACGPHAAGQQTSSPFVGDPPVAIWRLAEGSLAPSQSTAVLWRDPRDRPLLTVAAAGERLHLRSALRLDPGWSELASAHPTLLRAAVALLETLTDDRQRPSLADRDRRAAAPGEAEPTIVDGARADQTPIPWPEPARWPWLLVATLFLIERGLSRWR